MREAQNVLLNQNLSVPHLPKTGERRQTFIARLAESGNIAQAASQTDGGIGSARSYRRLQSNDPVCTGHGKGSDVNLASHLVRDAFTNQFDAAFVITNDTDLIEPIRVAKVEAGKILGLLSPIFRKQNPDGNWDDAHIA